MNSKYLGYLYFTVIVAASCNNNDNSTAPVTDTLKKDTVATDVPGSVYVPMAKQNDIIDTLNTLAFVKESNKYIDSISNHQHGIAYMIDTLVKEYIVTAGYNGADRFETYYNFSIDKKTREIKVQDAISGNMVTPKEFEKIRKANK